MKTIQGEGVKQPGRGVCERREPPIEHGRDCTWKPHIGSPASLQQDGHPQYKDALGLSYAEGRMNMREAT